MNPADLLAFALGAAIVAGVLFDVFQSVVVPRPTPGRYRPARLVVLYTWSRWRDAALRLGTPF